MANVFSNAKALRKQAKYKNTPWAELVQIAAGKSKHAAPKPKTKKAMATPRKRKAAPKKATARRKHHSVSGVRRTTTVTTRKKRTQVGAVVDRHMLYLAAGMALKSTVDAVIIDPLTKRIPGQFAMLIEPGKAVLGYMATKKFKSPLIQGVALGVMADGVNGTVKTMLGKLPMLSMSRPQMAQPGNVSGYYNLPSPALGQIPQYIGQIPQMIGNINNSSMPNIGDVDPGDEIILPLGYNK